MRSARPLFLAVPGLALFLLTLWGLRLQQRGEVPWFIAIALAQGAVYFVAVFWVSRRPSPLWLVLVFAALLRLPLLFSPPFLSTDLYRYVWDGRVQAAGISPYRFVPAAPELKALRDGSIYPHINRKEYAVTIYPPAAQLFFLATTRIAESVTWMKASVLACEGLAIWLLVLLLRMAGRPGAEVLLYAWHPLALWEFAGSGHLDAAAIALVLGALLARARGRGALTGVLLGLAALVKIYPLALFPALWRRRDFMLRPAGSARRRQSRLLRFAMPAALAATMALGYLPYLGVGPRVLGFLPDYLAEEGLQSGARYYLLRLAGTLASAQLHPALYLVPAGLLLAALSAWVWLRQPEGSGAGGALLLASAATLLLSPHYAWYLAWLLPLAALTKCTPVLLLGATSFVLYVSALVDNAETAQWAGNLLYLPFAVACIVWAAQTRALAGTTSPALAIGNHVESNPAD